MQKKLLLLSFRRNLVISAQKHTELETLLVDYV